MAGKKPKAQLVTVKGYGEDEGTELTLEFAGVEGDRIILNFLNPLDRDQYITVPFRAGDGFAVGHKPGRGYRIPKSVRRELTASANGGKLASEAIVGDEPRKAGKTMKVKVAGAKSTKGEDKPKAAKVKLPAATPASKNGKSTPKPEKSIAKAKENVKGGKTQAEAPARLGRKPSIERPEPGKREMRVKLSAGVYEELAGNRKLGAELKAAVKAATKDGAYMLIILNKETAATLMEVFAKASGTWSGVRGARLREGARRIAGELNERFKIKVPGELANRTAAKPAPEAKKTAPAKPKAKTKAPVEDDEDEDEEEAPKPKKNKKAKKSKKG